MRTLIITILFTFSLSSHSQIGIQFPDSGAVWKETYSWQPSPFFYNGIGDTYIEGDTIFNDTVYHKIYNLRRDVFCSDVIIQGPDYDGGLRDDTINNKVFYRLNENSNEKLLYDYTLQEGDTLPLEMSWFTFDEGVYVTDIDTITTFDGVNRRVWYLDHEEPFVGWPQIIEGIGSTSGLFGYIAPYFEGWNELLCYSVDNSMVWRSWRDTCYVITDSCATVGLNEAILKKLEIEISPNPFYDHFRLSNLPTYQSIDLTLFNSVGQIVFSEKLLPEQSEHQVRINPGLTSGIYLLKLTSGNQVSIIKKIIKK